MPTRKPVEVSSATFPDLDALFQRYGSDTPKNSFPSFLETLLFDHANGEAESSRNTAAECRREPHRRHPLSPSRH